MTPQGLNRITPPVAFATRLQSGLIEVGHAVFTVASSVGIIDDSSASTGDSNSFRQSFVGDLVVASIPLPACLGLALR